MKKIKIKFDYVLYFDEDFNIYLSNLRGVTSAIMDKKNEEIVLEYDSSMISLQILVKEILLYLDLIKVPSIIAFDKYANSHICKDTIVIKDLCCENCLKSMIEELLVTNGIESVYTDFDYVNKYNVNIFITYDDTVIDNIMLENLKFKFNN